MPAERKLLDLPRQSAVPVAERGGVQMTQEAERFLIQAKSAVYAGAAGEVDSSPLRSHSRLYADGKFRYTDSCLGTEQFAGQEVLLEGESPVWAANYLGRILERDFPINFLREALLAGCCSFGGGSSMKRGIGFTIALPGGNRTGSMGTKKSCTGTAGYMSALFMAAKFDKQPGRECRLHLPCRLPFR